jgi:hypothetical protein
MTAAAPAASAAWDNSIATTVPPWEVPTTTGNRPAAHFTKTSATRRRSPSDSLWASPMIPRTLRPWTPHRASNSTSVPMLASSTWPRASNGVAVMGMTPRSSVVMTRPSRWNETAL